MKACQDNIEHARALNAIEKKKYILYDAILKHIIKVFRDSETRILSLSQALKSKNEICVVESSGFYMLSLHQINSLIEAGLISATLPDSLAFIKMLKASKYDMLSASFNADEFYFHLRKIISES